MQNIMLPMNYSVFNVLSELALYCENHFILTLNKA